jgi:hypothetical protein
MKKNSKENKWTGNEGESSRIKEQLDKIHITKERWCKIYKIPPTKVVQ